MFWPPELSTGMGGRCVGFLRKEFRGGHTEESLTGQDLFKQKLDFIGAEANAERWSCHKGKWGPVA
jgi:hypothetical protein